MTDAEKAAVAAAVLVHLRARRAARALLASERHTLRLAMAAVTSAVAELVTHTATAPNDESAARAALHGVHVAMQRLAAALTIALAAGRAHARARGRASLADELEQAAPTAHAAHEPHSAASVAAASLAAAWAGSVMLAVRKWQRRPELSLPAAIARTAPALEARVRRTAATETAHAFNDERSLSTVTLVKSEAVADVAPLAETSAAQAAPAGGPYREAPEPTGPRTRLVKVWSAILDAKVCPECARMHGTVVLAHEEFPGGDPPRHPFCAPPGTEISTPSGAARIESLRLGDWVIGGLTGLPRRVVEVHDHTVDSEVVVIRVGGRTLRLTPNHPVLCQRGWVDAGALVPSDEVVCEFGEPWVALGDRGAGYTPDSPALGEQGGIFPGIDREFPFGHVPRAGVDLQYVAAGLDRQVRAVPRNRELRDTRNARTFDGASKGSFDRAHVARGLRGGRSLGEPLWSPGPATRGSVCGFHQALSPIGTFPSHTDTVRLARATLSDASGLQPSEYRSSRSSVVLGNGQDREALSHMHPNHILDGHHRQLGDGHPINLMQVRRVAMHIDRLERRPYAGHVHNVGVESDESYVANGIVVHNCRCVWLLIPTELPLSAVAAAYRALPEAA